MIFLGKTKEQKASEVSLMVKAKDITKVVVCSPAKFDFDMENIGVSVKWVDWPEIIMYRTFYPLLQEIDSRTLVIVNECLRSKDRHDLTYNCIRHYLNQAGHVMVFQWMPCIDTMQDFMTLFDFATGSKWKREKFDIDPPSRVFLDITQRLPQIKPKMVEASKATKSRYEKEKNSLFTAIGTKDPHTLPRNLLMVGAKDRVQNAGKGRHTVGRNTKEGALPYKSERYPDAPYLVLDLPHAFIDFCDLSSLSGQTEFEVMACDLKADLWYLSVYQEWIERIKNGYASLRAWA